MAIEDRLFVDSAALVARNLRRTVDSRPLMPKLSAEFHPATITFFVGPSGVGKSTALRLIGGLDPPDVSASPSVALGALVLGVTPMPMWRAEVLLVSQRPVTLPGSPMELFTRAASFSVRSGSSPLKRASVENFSDACFKLGLPLDRVSEEWSTLSGGEAQRAALAMGLALKPKALLLDEVTSALDPDSTRLVEAAIVEFCVTHNVRVAWISHDEEQPGRVEALAPSAPLVVNFQELMVDEASSV